MCMTLGCVTVQKEGSIKAEIHNIYFSSVSIKNGLGVVSGSGTIINNKVGQQMLVLTAAHVIKSIVEKNQIPFVSTAFNDKDYIMGIYKIDYDLDLALLYSIDVMEKSSYEVNISLYGANIGDPVWVIGSPLGDERTVTNGIISNFETNGKRKLYRTTAAIFFGNSGGGMFNVSGDLIGVANSIQQVQIGFSIIGVPGGSFFIGLESIRTFI